MDRAPGRRVEIGGSIKMNLTLASRRDGDRGDRATPHFDTVRRRLEACRPTGALVMLLTVAACGSASPPPAPTNVLGSVPLAPAASSDVPNSLVYRAPD